MPLGSRITLTPIAAKRVSISAVWSGANLRLSLPPGCRITTLVPFCTALFNRANISLVVLPLIPALTTRAFKPLARSSASSWAGYA